MRVMLVAVVLAGCVAEPSRSTELLIKGGAGESTKDCGKCHGSWTPNCFTCHMDFDHAQTSSEIFARSAAPDCAVAFGSCALDERAAQPVDDCKSCHSGITNAHPNGASLSCVACHGGNAIDSL